MFDMYKHAEDLTVTAVQNDFSVRGSEFIDLIAAIITSRCVHKTEDAGILKDLSYKNLLTDLGQIWRKTDAPIKAKHSDGFWIREFKEVLDHMEKLGLYEGEPELIVPKKTGRPKKEKTEQADKPKRPVGRPRMHPLPDPNVPKRPRGRPRKNPEPAAKKGSDA